MPVGHRCMCRRSSAVLPSDMSRCCVPMPCISTLVGRSKTSGRHCMWQGGSGLLAPTRWFACALRCGRSSRFRDEGPSDQEARARELCDDANAQSPWSSAGGHRLHRLADRYSTRGPGMAASFAGFGRDHPPSRWPVWHGAAQPPRASGTAGPDQASVQTPGSLQLSHREPQRQAASRPGWPPMRRAHLLRHRPRPLLRLPSNRCRVTPVDARRILVALLAEASKGQLFLIRRRGRGRMCGAMLIDSETEPERPPPASSTSLQPA